MYDPQSYSSILQGERRINLRSLKLISRNDLRLLSLL